MATPPLWRKARVTSLTLPRRQCFAVETPNALIDAFDAPISAVRGTLETRFNLIGHLFHSSKKVFLGVQRCLYSTIALEEHGKLRAGLFLLDWIFKGYQNDLGSVLSTTCIRSHLFLGSSNVFSTTRSMFSRRLVQCLFS